MSLFKSIRFLMPILFCVLSYSSANAATDKMSADGYCAGNIDGRGTAYIKACARAVAENKLVASCRELNGVVSRVDSNNPLWACKTVGDMMQGCRGTAVAECIH